MNPNSSTAAPTFAELMKLVRADQFRYQGRQGWQDFMVQWFREAGFRFTCILRLCRFLRGCGWSRYTLYYPVLLWHRTQQVIYGLHIDFSTVIGPGLYLGHPMSIVVNRRTVIGANCTLSHGVTLGQTNSRSKRPGCPSLGDRVYLGCGSVIVGAVHLGHDCAVAPNSVVVRDVNSLEVVAGNPAVVISNKGSGGYVAFVSESSSQT